jgi:hypothetical protein
MKLLQNALKRADFAINQYAVALDRAVEFDDVLKPEFWSHVSRDLKPGDRIDVTSYDREWIAQLYVRAVREQTVEVAALQHYVFAAPAPEHAEFGVEFVGAAGWCVFRRKDSARLAEKLDTRQHAERWIAQHCA